MEVVDAFEGSVGDPFGGVVGEVVLSAGDDGVDHFLVFTVSGRCRRDPRTVPGLGWRRRSLSAA